MSRCRHCNRIAAASQWKIHERQCYAEWASQRLMEMEEESLTSQGRTGNKSVVV